MNSLQDIPTQDMEATNMLSLRLRNELGDSLRQILLFGSKARGDGDHDADIDILVISENEDGPTRQKILRLGARVSLEKDVLFNIFPVSIARWRQMAEIGYPLYQAIVDDGIEIPLPQQT
jgi:predicted nucleotidyltransferase